MFLEASWLAAEKLLTTRLCRNWGKLSSIYGMEEVVGGQLLETNSNGKRGASSSKSQSSFFLPFSGRTGLATSVTIDWPFKAT